jgi:hypothetical protein
MDYIPRVQNPVHPPIEVPFLVLDRHRYDNKGFSGFPPRMGFDPERLRNGDFGGKNGDEVISFPQAWCFFG